MDKRTCSTEGCHETAGVPGSARGLCKNCYYQWWWKNRRPGSSSHRGVKRDKGVRLQDVAPRVCQQCGTPFLKTPKETYAQWQVRKFCVGACRMAAQRGIAGTSGAPLMSSCLRCGTAFRVKPSKLGTAKFCSRTCTYAFRDQGITAANKRVRFSPEYRRWREAVFDRDNYTCQMCGQRGGDLNADHIKPFAFFPELRFDVGNGRTLCVSCHRTTETYGPRVHKLGFRRTG